MDISDFAIAEDVIDASIDASPEAEEAPAWETSKENAQPLRRGRNAKALGERLEAGPMPVAGEEPERAAFEARLRAEAASEDPLAPWCDYIRWQQETAVTGGGLLPLLERCAHEFKDDTRYADDARYLRVWLAYADLVKDAEPLFDYLNDRYVGVTFAAFWEAWAACLEAKGKPEAADKAFTQGLMMKAQPTGRLQRAHREFQGRLMKRIMKSAQDGAASAQPGGGGGSRAMGAGTGSSKEKARKTLNRLTTKEAAGSHRPTTQRAAAPIVNKPAAKPPAPGSDAFGNFQIFDEAAAPPAPAPASGARAPQPWETGTASENAKENSAAATTWNDPLVPPKDKAARRAAARPVVPPPADFAIHLDADFETADGDDEAAATAAGDGTDAQPLPMRLQLAGPSLLVSNEIESLQTRPLARFVEADAQAEEPSPPPAAAPPLAPAKKGLAPARPGGGGFAIFCDENAAPSNRMG